jgi:hypothetical protein
MENKDVSQISLQVFSELVGRAALASQVGKQTYGGNRDIYNALGYPNTENLDATMYAERYRRQDMAKAIIDRPVRATWKGSLDVIETTSKKVTPFEKAWTDFSKEQKLKLLFPRCDRLTRMGRYSVLFFGMDDVKDSKGYTTEVAKGAKLLYLKPLSEQSAKIDSLENDPKNPRFGKPKYYNITIKNESSTTDISKNLAEVKVHYSRVLHLIEDTLEDEVYGIPVLESVFNRLLDLEKLIGGDAEMFWRGARPGYTGTVAPEYEMSPAMRDALKEQIEEFEHNLKRVLVNEGVEYKALEQQIADPLNHVDVQVQMISAVTGIPKRILIGSERGELSSSQDKQEWVSYVTMRREEVIELTMLRPFIDKCIELNILPKPKNYRIVWDKLFSLTDKERVELGKGRAVILKEYSANVTAQDMIPMDQFLQYFLGLDQNQVEEVIANQPSKIREPEPATVQRGTRGSEIMKAEERKTTKENK